MFASTIVMKDKIEKQEAYMNVLSTKFETKVQYLDELSGRKPRAETLKEELERIERLSQ